MKAATDFETLFNVETAVETAWQGVLDRAGIRCYRQREDGELIVPLVRVQCALGTETGHVGFDRENRAWADAWAYRLDFEVITRRGAGGPDAHAHFRSRVRLLTAYSVDAFPASVLPFHVLTQRKHLGTVPAIATEDDTDVSTITVGGVVSIRSDESGGAWPEA
jgi:hypothetical protein